MLKSRIMAVREIRKYPDTILGKKTAPVDAIDGAIHRLIDDMVDTMHAAPGVGLAANQVGVPVQVAIIDLSAQKEYSRHPLIVLINPEILTTKGSVIEEEGCLSIPEFVEKITRAAMVTVRAQDRSGAVFELEAEGLLAKALQHEIDHLNGMLFVDRLSQLKRNIFRRKYRKTVLQKA
ncbi:MAG TPA: peptide deformylase [Nitrospiraceae bacterium]|nr:peptide deformylase [Nitrospiraceae bacterium]